MIPNVICVYTDDTKLMVDKTAGPLVRVKAMAPITIFFSAMHSQLKEKKKKNWKG